MATLNAVLNWLVPLIVILVFAAMLYSKMKDPIDTFFRWIGKGFKWALGRGKEKTQETYETVYSYG